MSEPFQEYLKLLRDVSAQLEQLAVLSTKKADVVRDNDLMGLDEVLKQEQALGLNLRGLELRRLKLIPQLGLEESTLSDLPSKCPPELQMEAKKTMQDLQNSYSIYRSCADMARNVLELNLHKIDKFVTAHGGSAKDLDAGYAPPGVEPPKNMKTDFRA